MILGHGIDITDINRIKKSYLRFGEKFIMPYRIIYIISIGFGGVCAMEVVWHLADIFNGLMAYPNLIAIVLLSPKIFKMTKEHKLKSKSLSTKTD